MGRRYAELAFTPLVKKQQQRHGSNTSAHTRLIPPGWVRYDSIETNCAGCFLDSPGTFVPDRILTISVGLRDL